MKKVKMFEFVTNRRVQRKVPKEQGRSMVEMLGVLAIIGVLSIGGIAGYTMAMNRYKANQIVDLANKLSIMIQTAVATDPDHWRDNMSEVFSEMGIDEYNQYDVGVPQYEVTFSFYEDGSVWGGSHNTGIHKAIQSVTGNNEYGSGGGPIVEVD